MNLISKLFVLLFLPMTLLAQTPPIIKSNPIPDDIHGHVVHLPSVDSKLNDNNISHFARSAVGNSTTTTNIIDYLTAGQRSQVTGHRSKVTGPRSQVTGHRSQKDDHQTALIIKLLSE